MPTALFNVVLWLSRLVAGAAFLLLVSCGQSGEAQNLLSPKDFQKELANPEAVLLDVRTPAEFGGGHLKGAQNIDWNGPDFGKAVAGISREKTILVYCLSGGRSASAARFLRKAGFARVLEMEGGILRWQSEGLSLNGAETRPAGMSRADFQAKLGKRGAVLVDFYAEWCGPCKKMKPLLAELEKEQAGKTRILRIDADQHPELMKELGISGLPTLKMYRDQKEVWKGEGFHSLEQLRRIVSEH